MVPFIRLHFVPFMRLKGQEKLYTPVWCKHRRKSMCECWHWFLCTTNRLSGMVTMDGSKIRLHIIDPSNCVATEPFVWTERFISSVFEPHERYWTLSNVQYHLKKPCVWNGSYVLGPLSVPGCKETVSPRNSEQIMWQQYFLILSLNCILGLVLFFKVRPQLFFEYSWMFLSFYLLLLRILPKISVYYLITYLKIFQFKFSSKFSLSVLRVTPS